MKDILKQFAHVLVAIGGCIIQLVALVFASIGWVFNKLASLLADVSYMTVDETDEETETDEEEISEETPT